VEKLHEIVLPALVEGVVELALAVFQVVVTFVVDPLVGRDVVCCMNNLYTSVVKTAQQKVH
jgi:hypothetical protein